MKLTKDFLVEHYQTQGKSVLQIANETGCDRKTLSRYLEKFGIPKRQAKIGKLQIKKEIGSWTILKRVGSRKYRVRCECGTVATVDGYTLLNGTSTQCLSCRRAADARNPLWKGYGSIGMTWWNRTKRSAAQRELNFEITIDRAWQLLEEQGATCKLSGLPLTFGMNTTASIDRIDSSQGYIEGNIQWVHKVINKMKSDLPQTTFLEFCALVAKRTHV